MGDKIELPNIEDETKEEDTGILRFLKRRYLTEIEVVLFGFALVIGNRNITWNGALLYGFESYLFNLLFVGSAYVCLCLCMGEMVSALPFSGGIFGFVRAAAGPYLGYITAWFEIAFVLTYIIIKVDQVMKILIALQIMTLEFYPYAILIFYGSSYVLNVLGGKPFWGLVSILGFGSFCLYLIYLGGAADASVRLGTLDYKTFCENTALPLSLDNILPGRTSINGFYQGLHFIPLLSDSLKRPREQIPRALMIVSLTFVFLSVFLSLSSCSQFPGIAKLRKAKYPLSYGFSNVFRVSLDDATWFSVPGMYAVGFCLYFCAGKQIHAISKSGMLFKVFSVLTPGFRTPFMSYFAAAAISVGLHIYQYNYVDAYAELRNVAVLASHIVFLMAFVSYLLFKYRYSSLARSFVSPLGIWGALYGGANYCFGVVSLVEYSGNTYYSVYALCCLFGAATLFYWIYMVTRQQFSDEEKKLMFKAYLINANREKRMRMLKGNNKVGSSTVNTNTKKKQRKFPTSESEGFDIHDNMKILPVEYTLVETKQSERNFPSLNAATRSVSFLQAPTSDPHQMPLALHSPRSRKSISSQISQFFSSGKFLLPLDHNTEVEECEQKMMILAAGGLLDQEAEASLKHHLGFDLESSEVEEQRISLPEKVEKI